MRCHVNVQSRMYRRCGRLNRDSKQPTPSLLLHTQTHLSFIFTSIWMQNWPRKYQHVSQYEFLCVLQENYGSCHYNCCLSVRQPHTRLEPVWWQKLTQREKQQPNVESKCVASVATVYRWSVSFLNDCKTKHEHSETEKRHEQHRDLNICIELQVWYMASMPQTIWSANVRLSVITASVVGKTKI